MFIYSKSDPIKFKNIKNTDEIILITQFFYHKNTARNEEIKYCLSQNMQNKYINKIYLLNEKIYTDAELSNTNITDKIIQINVNKRLEYKDVFEFVNKFELKGYIVFANCDIYLDETINIIRYTLLDQEKIMIALLRYENNIIYGPRYDSQDTWIFHSNYNILNNNVFQFEFGKPGCDNKFCYLCKILGYKIINCPKKIKSHHVHTSNIRNYNEIDKLPGPYLAVEPLDYFSDNNNLFIKYILTETDYFTKYNFNDNNLLGLYIKNNFSKNIKFIIPQNIDFKQNIKLLYYQLYFEAFENCDTMLCNESYNQSNNSSYYFINTFYNNKNIIWSNVVNIYNYIYNPWTFSLNNQKILIISPYSQIIEQRIPFKNKIYGINLFPDCQFIFIKPLLDFNSDTFLENNLLKIVNLIKQLLNNFTLALIDLNIYGNILCNEIYKLDKSAINIGSTLPLYFGLYKDDIIEPNNLKDILNIYVNEFWIKIE